jgi:hypothetical protein
MERIKIRVKGQLDESWSNRFDGLSITHTESGETVLSGIIRDQSALLGLIFNLADIGLPIISIDTLPQVEGQYGNLREKEVTTR